MFMHRSSLPTAPLVKLGVSVGDYGVVPVLADHSGPQRATLDLDPQLLNPLRAVAGVCGRAGQGGSRAAVRVRAARHAARSRSSHGRQQRK